MSGPYLVTGAAGCVGRAVVERLAERGESVVGMDIAPRPPDFPGRAWVQADLLDPGSYQAGLEGAATVIHLAAKVHSVPVSQEEADVFHRVNVVGTELLVDAAVRAGASRFLLASTVAVLAAPREERLSDAYAASKRAAEAAVLRRCGEIGVVIARPTTVYGPGDRGNICRLIRWIDRGLPPIVGNGNNRKSLVFVRNLAAALDTLALQGSDERPYVVADVPAPSMNELVEAICRHLGRRNRWPRIPLWPAVVVTGILGRRDTLEKLTGETVFETSLLLELGFSSPCGFDEGIGETVRWCIGGRSG